MPTAEVIRQLLYRRDVALARHRATLARAAGLTDSELLALVHLREQGPLSPSRLARLLDLSSGGVTALVQRLEASGHVGREPHPTDGRSALIRLSATMAARLGDAESPVFSELERTTAALSAPEAAAVADFLQQLASLTEQLAAVTTSGAESDAADSRAVPSLWA